METVIDRNSGQMTMFVIKEVVEDENQIEDPQAQWTLDQAKKIEPEPEVGGKIRLSDITKQVVDVVRDPNTQIPTKKAQQIEAEVRQADDGHVAVREQ